MCSLNRRDIFCSISKWPLAKIVGSPINSQVSKGGEKKKYISIISRNNEVEELMPWGAVAENSIFLQHGTQAEDKYLSAGTLPATCPSIKEIISSSYYNKDLKKLNL